MKYSILDKSHDPMGAAISDFHRSGKAARLRVLSSMFEEDEMPVAHLFRQLAKMPRLEQKALEMHADVCSTSVRVPVVMRWLCRNVALR